MQWSKSTSYTLSYSPTFLIIVSMKGCIMILCRPRCFFPTALILQVEMHGTDAAVIWQFFKVVSGNHSSLYHTLSLYSSIYLCNYLSTYLSVYLSICLFLSLSLSLFHTHTYLLSVSSFYLIITISLSLFLSLTHSLS